MKIKYVLFVLLINLTSCTLPRLACLLKFAEYNKTYDFPFSKNQLKAKIVEAYSYDENLLVKNFGKTLIENEAVNKKYRISTEIWLDKRNWEQFNSEILNSTADTLVINICKFHSREGTNLNIILNGDDSKSTLTIKEFSYERKKVCDKDKNKYKVRQMKLIEKKFISKLE